MKWCYEFVGSYGVAIILFTLLTKIVLMPISIWIQKNSILMVKIQPEINFLKANNYGNLDVIADGQAKIYKKAHYHPLVTIIPLILQIILLLAVVEIIEHPVDYLGVVPDTEFLIMDLSVMPSDAWGLYVLVPLVAGASAWVMCFTQNLSNVLQHEQSKWNQYGMMILSVGLSLYLGLFVETGIAVYWVASNLLAVAQMYLLNVMINPKKYVDYDMLEESRKALAIVKSFVKDDKSDGQYKENKKREKADYKRFKKIVNKHVVFYSERSGFYKYYKDIIDEFIKRSNLTIHYITNDPKDVIFEIAKTEPRIKPYYIGIKKLNILMMLLETDMFICTTPELGKYYLKKSYVKKDINYVYCPHDTMSSFYGFKEGAFDNFDTILCVGEHFKNETRKTEEVYKLKPKTLVEFGFPLSDYLEKMGEEENRKRETAKSDVKKVLVAPSWQEDNILDSCIDNIITGLYGDGYKIIVRPHPEYIKRYSARLNKIVDKYSDYDKDKLVFETDFSASESVYSSDVIITDWSGIGPEFCFATKRPAIFVNTKEKCGNPNWQKIGMTPVEMSLRKELGVCLEKEDTVNIKAAVEELFASGESYRAKITEIYSKFLYNHGCAAEAGAKQLLLMLAAKNKK